MSILNELKYKDQWEAYFEAKKSKGNLESMKEEVLREFIDQERYVQVVERMTEGGFNVSVPQEILVSKKNTSRKRALYLLDHDEALVMKLLNHFLFRYSHCFSDACYSFRGDRSVKHAMEFIAQIEYLQTAYTVKVDIRNYFNSIPADRLVALIRQIFSDDPPLMEFLSRFYGRGQAICDGEVVNKQMGAISGTAIAGFFANIYLTDMDNYFLNKGIQYLRYSDDIILFTKSEEEQKKCLRKLQEMIEERGLEFNPSKFKMTAPGEKWEYLGLSYQNGHFDLAEATVYKLKQRIRRFARYLYRERREGQGMSFEEVAAQFIARFNDLFFVTEKNTRFSWQRWYFPVITTDRCLRRVDALLQEYIRYLYSGRHYKGNYVVTYEKMRELGYRSLVSEYYEYLNSPQGIRHRLGKYYAEHRSEGV